MKQIRFLSLANQEVDDAVQWYQEQSVGLSQAFLNELDRVVRLISRYPHVATMIEPEIRRFLLTRFRYSLIYGIDDKTVVLIAVAHHRRRPKY